ncbi:SapC family protein [Mesorhizobium sp. Cs1299R1N1]|uniref:SapC family protein n=1 Tax=Mesorhizobium sp. Cs1299R1N1 TaxID=3015172 RepID=UPI00301CE46D
MTKNTQENLTKPLLPLFYKDPVLLRFEDHRDARLAPVAGFGFAREAVAIPLCIGEFAMAMRHYPIVFAIDENASPIALVAIKREHNLFVERDGSWRDGSYIPAYVRRYPFIGTETPDKAGQLLSIDRASDRFVPSTGDLHDAERLFDGAGGPTATAQSAMAFCQAYYADSTNTVAFGRALVAANLLTPYHVDIRLPDGSQHQVNGFSAVDEKAFRALPAETVTDWHANGWLDLVILHLTSLQSFQGLLGLNAQRANERKVVA